MIFRNAGTLPKTAASRRLSSSHQPYQIVRRTFVPQRSISLMPRGFFPPSPFSSSRSGNNTGGEFSSLFRLLDDYTDHISRRFDEPFFQGADPNQIRSFTPKFDIRETDDAYHLDGEVPGIEKDGLQIEFLDEKTLQIKGRTERSFSSRTPPPAEAEATAVATDDVSANVTSTTAADQAVAQSTTESTKPSTAETNERYWVSERSVGEFSRTFSFPVPVDQEAVKASLKNGVLSITVPKKVTEQTVRRIKIE